jgi:hypothetical protein
LTGFFYLLAPNFNTMAKVGGKRAGAGRKSGNKKFRE